MAAYLYPLYALAALGLSLGEARLVMKSPNLTVGLLLLVTLAMAYDSFAIAIGTSLGESLLLKRLNHLRFLLHDLATPLLIVVALNLAGAAGLSGSDGWPVQGASWLVAVVLMGISFAADAQCRELSPVSCAGTLRYRLRSFSPAASLVTTAGLLAVGLALWLVAQEPWLLLAALAVAIANGIRGAEARLVLSPCAELVLVGSVLVLAV